MEFLRYLSVHLGNIIFKFFHVLLGVYADGPGAYLFHGVVEQQYVFHVMDHALCLSSSKQKSCDKHVKRMEAVKNTAQLNPSLSMHLLLLIMVCWMAGYTQ